MPCRNFPCAEIACCLAKNFIHTGEDMEASVPTMMITTSSSNIVKPLFLTIRVRVNPFSKSIFSKVKQLEEKVRQWFSVYYGSGA